MSCQEIVNGEALRWRWTMPLGTCIYNTYDQVAISFGIASMVIWTFALLPQIVLNYQNGSAENQSMYFWLLWICGDVMNLVGCLLAHEIVTNTGLAAVYLFFTIICFAQYIWYNMLKGSKEERGRALKLPKALPISRSPSFGASSPNLRRRNYGAAAATGATAIIGMASMYTLHNDPELARRMLGDDGGQDASTSGIVLGWLMCIVYTMSRLPQIFLMIRNQEVEGISTLFFFLTFSGNLTQFLAMTVKESFPPGYWWPNMPWLLSASVCAVEDILVLCIFWKIVRDENLRAKKKQDVQEPEETDFLLSI